MAISHFSQFLDGVVIRDKNILSMHPGKVFYVSNSTTPIVPGGNVGSDTRKGTINNPVATIARAVALCTAGRGDIVVVAPGHAETISSASALTLSKSHVAIVGMGVGALRPTLTLDTATTATINVTAASVTVHNIIVTANFADIVAAFTTTTAKDFTLSECLIKATATNMNFLNVIDTNATTSDTDGLTVTGVRWIEPDTATLSLISMDGTNDRLTVEKCNVTLGVNNNKALVTVANGKVVTNVLIADNLVYRLNTDTATGALLFHTNGTTNSGIVCRNFSQHADTAAELIVTASSGLGLFQNYSSGVVGNSGYVIATIDS